MKTGFPIPLTAEQLLEKARDSTGIDLIDEKAIEPLRVLLESYNTEAGMTKSGATAMQDLLLNFLKNRLYMQRDFIAHPEIGEIELRPPVIINAMARTGSTKMQKVLAATGDFNWLSNWMVMNPASRTGKPYENLDNRIAEVETHNSWFDTASPEARNAHSFNAHEAEEDSTVMMQSLISPTLTGYAAAPSYVEWSIKEGMGHQFLYVRDTLKYLVWQGLADPRKPFVLKSAMSYGFETDVLAAFPGAKLIMTHRDPRSCIASSCRLIEVFNAAYSEQPIDFKQSFEGMAFKMDLHLDFRKTNPSVGILDIDYRDLRSAAAGLLKDIFAFADMNLKQSVIDNVKDWEDKNPKNKHGNFSYSMQDFGLNGQMIDARFANYIKLASDLGIEWPR